MPHLHLGPLRIGRRVYRLDAADYTREPAHVRALEYAIRTEATEAQAGVIETLTFNHLGLPTGDLACAAIDVTVEYIS